jgi:murein DD-endopeptidase MepM/ murein hydrolase activator NlpD
MPRSNYYFNHKTCSYEPIPISLKKVLTNIMGVLVLAVASGLGALFLYTKYFDSPLEKRLRKENSMLRKQYFIVQSEISKASKVISELREQDEILYRTILNSAPIKEVLTRDKVSITFEDILVQDTFERLNDLKQKIKNQSESYRHLLILAKKREIFLASIPAIQPISNRTLKRIADGFGMRLHPIHKVSCMHKGMDYVAPIGTQVYATGNGYVKLAKFCSGYGNTIEIDHGSGIMTRYAHLNAFNNLSVGDRVVRGQCIGYVGVTGSVTGPHLHYEVIRDKNQTNPINYMFGELNAAQYDQVIQVASRRSRNLG